jgi:hypothetical protein
MDKRDYCLEQWVNEITEAWKARKNNNSYCECNGLARRNNLPMSKEIFFVCGECNREKDTTRHIESLILHFTHMGCMREWIVRVVRQYVGKNEPFNENSDRDILRFINQMTEINPSWVASEKCKIILFNMNNPALYAEEMKRIHGERWPEKQKVCMGEATRHYYSLTEEEWDSGNLAEEFDDSRD